MNVLSHLATSVDLNYDGKLLHISMLHNPSHLEASTPVGVGKARAKQTFLGDHDRNRVLPLLVHGDAAFSGQGVIMETFTIALYTWI